MDPTEFYSLSAQIIPVVAIVWAASLVGLIERGQAVPEIFLSLAVLLVLAYGEWRCLQVFSGDVDPSTSLRLQVWIALAVGWGAVLLLGVITLFRKL
jgi:hypothetical protein